MRLHMVFARFLICALLVAAPALAQKPLREVTASYRLTRGGVPIGIMHEQFEMKEQRFQISSETRATGLLGLVQPKPALATSAGGITELGLQPQRFEAARGADDPRRVSADFDWARSRLTIRHDGREETLALPAGTQDRLSAMYQFMFVDFDNVRHIETAMTNGRKLGNYFYAVTPGVEIDTALGRMPTLHLVKRHDPDDNRAEIWLSPAHAYLPVKMLVVGEDGIPYEQSVIKLILRP